MTFRPFVLPAFVLLAAFIAAGCASVRTQRSERRMRQTASLAGRTDEVIRRDTLAAARSLRTEQSAETSRTLLLSTEGIPAQTAELTLPLARLAALPEGAKYTAHHGRATVEAERQGDSIVVRGRADSLARRVLCIAAERTRSRQSHDSLARQHAGADTLTRQLTAFTASREQAAVADAQRRKRSLAWLWWLGAGFVAGGVAAALLTGRNPLKAIRTLIH